MHTFKHKQKHDNIYYIVCPFILIFGEHNVIRDGITV